MVHVVAANAYRQLLHVAQVTHIKLIQLIRLRRHNKDEQVIRVRQKSAKRVDATTLGTVPLT